MQKNKILSSKSEARRVILNKGLKLNDRVVEDEKKLLQLKDFEKSIETFGKRSTALLRLFRDFIFINNFLNKSWCQCSNWINSSFTSPLALSF